MSLTETYIRKRRKTNVMWFSRSHVKTLTNKKITFVIQKGKELKTQEQPLLV